MTYLLADVFDYRVFFDSAMRLKTLQIYGEPPIFTTALHSQDLDACDISDNYSRKCAG